MPNRKQCEKRLRQEKKREARNNYVKKTLNTFDKKIRGNMSLEEKQDFIKQVYAQLDKAVKKGVIHQRTASRRKSRITSYLNKELKNSEIK